VSNCVGATLTIVCDWDCDCEYDCVGNANCLQLPAIAGTTKRHDAASNAPFVALGSLSTEIVRNGFPDTIAKMGADFVGGNPVSGTVPFSLHTLFVSLYAFPDE
jgi:hypothetical protein